MQNLYLDPLKVNRGFSVKGNGVRHALYQLLSQPLSDQELLGEIKTLQGAFSQQTDTLMVRCRGKNALINVSDIQFIEAAGAYSYIVTKNRRYLISKTLKVLTPTLPDTFLRVHRSYLVPIEQIESFRLNVLQLKNGDSLVLSKNGRKLIAHHLNNQPSI
jgi:DNA-binding LytR/AlgR family response regulator